MKQYGQKQLNKKWLNLLKYIFFVTFYSLVLYISYTFLIIGYQVFWVLKALYRQGGGGGGLLIHPQRLASTWIIGGEETAVKPISRYGDDIYIYIYIYIIV